VEKKDNGYGLVNLLNIPAVVWLAQFVQNRITKEGIGLKGPKKAPE